MIYGDRLNRDIHLGDRLNRDIHLAPYCDQIFNENEIEKIINVCKAYKAEPAFTGNKFTGSELNLLKRRSTIKWLPDDDTTLWIYERFKQFIDLANTNYNFDIVGAEPIQYTEYSEENLGEYNWHLDYDIICRYKYMRKLSVSVFLTDKKQHIGGDFVFSLDGDELFIPEQKKGWGVIFPSWIPHRVTPVISGVRKSLVMWTYGPIFR